MAAPDIPLTDAMLEAGLKALNELLPWYAQQGDNQATKTEIAKVWTAMMAYAPAAPAPAAASPVNLQASTETQYPPVAHPLNP